MGLLYPIHYSTFTPGVLTEYLNLESPIYYKQERLLYHQIFGYYILRNFNTSFLS